GEVVDQVQRGGLGEDLLGAAGRDRALRPQQRLHPVEELGAPVLPDVEQHHPPAADARRARRERLRRPDAVVERAHVVNGHGDPTSRETIWAPMPVHGPRTAESRPASPPATISTIASGDAHLGTCAAGSAAWTNGVVSPRRSSLAGLWTASNMKRRSCCLVHPAARN